MQHRNQCQLTRRGTRTRRSKLNKMKQIAAPVRKMFSGSKKMKETTLDGVVEVAEIAQAANKSWHFHILSPTCHFNTKPDKFALVVEVVSDSQAFVSYQDQRPSDAGKRLVALLHGSKVLQGKGEAQHIENATAAAIVRRAKVLNDQRIPWHHHMMFPKCAINPNPGKWNLTFEDPQTGETLNAMYDLEPIEDLKEVEALYYAQLK